jgi:transcriptional regulator of acetoin/glycerol metabolism
MRAADHAQKVLSVMDGEEAARSAVAASWRRCLTTHHLDPEDRAPPPMLSDAELRAVLGAMEPLARAATSAMDHLFQAVGEAGCCVVLTDPQGVLIARRGAAADDDAFRRAGLWLGAAWDEARAGTNGIGACLSDGRPLSIHRDQHFHSRNIGLSCTAAPVYDHRGLLAGALDVSSARGDLGQATLGLMGAAVRDAARRIEAQAFRQAFPHARILLAEDNAPERASSPLIAVDADDLVIGATRAARRALGLTDEMIRRGLPAADLAPSPDADGHPEMAVAERMVIQRALARSGGNVSAASAALGVSRATLHRKMNRLGLARH